MPRGQQIPITATVLSWAIDESGWSRADLAAALSVPETVLRAWEAGDTYPNKTQFNGLVRHLKRPSATFFLPIPPPPDDRKFDFRSFPGESASLGPEELRNLRDARRVQEELSWILQDLDHPEVELFPASLDQDPEDVARSERERLGVSTAAQFGWTKESEAFEAWSTALAGAGVFVFAQQVGRGNIRGFAFQDSHAPIIGINTTGFNIASRIYTMFHEYAHILLGRSDVMENLIPTEDWDRSSDVERWCERFAASFLVPRDDLEDYLKREFHWSPGAKIEPSKLNRLASRFKVSRRAMALRLVEIGAASWSLFKSLGPSPERRGGGGGGDRRPVMVRRRFGIGVISLLSEALDQDALGINEMLDLLGITFDDWVQLEAEARP